MLIAGAESHEQALASAYVIRVRDFRRGAQATIVEEAWAPGVNKVNVLPT
jgi:hypothetical protein